MSTPGDPSRVPAAVQTAADALLRLGEARPEIAESLARLILALAEEAGRSARFASALHASFAAGEATTGSRPRKTGRRSPGALDPFAVFGEGGEKRLREQLAQLDLDQLRDIVAQHGMDHDRLAMKWKDPARVIDRIVDKVSARAAKGSAFRNARE